MIIEGVLFDFHGTLVDGGDPDRWIAAALRHPAAAGSTPPPALAKHLFDIWQHAHHLDPHSDRDLDHARHRDVFGRAAALCPGGLDPGLITALYEVMPDQWLPFDDTLPVLRELRARGVPVAVLSNIGLDIRGRLDRAGILDLIDGVVLSFETGVVKPDPAIFARALEAIGVPGDRTLMVGDSARDDVGGVSLGIRTLILPRTEGPVHGLATVLQMVRS